MSTKEEKDAAKAAKQAEKDATKAAKQAEKDAAKAAKDAAKAGAGATPVVIVPPVVTPAPLPPPADSHDDIEVGEPLLLRPVDLPLVVKPAKGKEWANEAQVAYAQTLNAYAYKNPAKWAKKKDALIKNLADLATDPSKLAIFTGGGNAVQYNDKRISA